MRQFSSARRLALILAVLLILSWLTMPSAGQATEGANYLDQLRGSRQENWLQRQVQYFISYAHLDRANRLLKEGHLPEARQELEKYLAKAPQDYAARYNYLLILFKMKDYVGTIQQADLILKARPHFVPAYLYRGLARQALGRLPQALEDFRAAGDQQQITPEDRRFALGMVADLAIRQKNYALALKELDRLQQSGTDFSLFYRRGLALEGLKRWPAAAQAYRQALERAKDNPERLSAYLALGEVARKRQDWPSAFKAFRAAQGLEPKSPAVLRTLAQLAYDRKDYQASAVYIKRALALHPNSRDRAFLVNILGFMKDYRDVTQQLTGLLPEAQTPAERFHIYSALGDAYNKWGKYSEAAANFQAAARLKPDLATLEALAQAREREGHLAQAIAEYRTILQRWPSPQVHLTLGILLNKAGDYEEAVMQLERASSGGSANLKYIALKKQGFLYYHLGRYAEAQRSLQRALALRPHDPALYQSLVEIALKLKEPEQALQYQKKAIEVSRRPGTLGLDWEKLGLIALQLERYQEAEASFRKALAAGQDRWNTRQNLGITLLKLKKWPEAVKQFRLALKTRQTPQTEIYLGLTYQKLGKPGLAIYFLEQSLASRKGLKRKERRDTLNTLGYLYAEEKQYAEAARAWSQTLALGADPVVSLNLGKMQSRLGQSQEALATLDGLAPDKLPQDLRAQRLDEIAAILKEQHEPAKALQALTQANQLKPTANRDYRIGLIYQEERQPQGAIPYLQKAISSDPDNNHYKVALGYAYLSEKNYAETARVFGEVLRRDPDYLKLYPDMGYCNMHLVNNDKAVKWFKRAIDNQPFYPVSTPEEVEKLRQRIYRYRKEVSKIINRYDFTAYMSYTTTKASQSVVPGVLGGGAVPSQGGVEFAYQPPGIGFRDERIFQAFVRVLWNIKPSSLRINPDSFQGGVGLRYKPLKTQNFYLWGERLFKMGNDALNTWLLRLLYSWDYGYDLKPGKPWWDYTFVYGDAAYFTTTVGTWAYYAEFRQGVTFNFHDKILLTPHLVVDARYQDPLNASSSYLEEGAGVSLKFLFLATHYEIHRASFEILAYYKHGNFFNRQFQLSGNKYDGLYVTGIFHF